ncbi:MAG: DUF11 domain-containing protein [Gammaproteobacteria bacterium]|nr:DUF11 domain-containing protein [Gammaproteobacteria bacterium]
MSAGAVINLLLLLACAAASAVWANHATPGKDGPGGTLTGIVNTYYPGTASAAAGSTSLAIGAAAGAATPIAAGDLLLVIQMQGADINTTNTSAYGSGVTGNPGLGLLPGSLIAGRHEYVEALGPVTGGSVAIRGLGAGNGLIHSYVSAAAGAQGQRSFQVIRVPQYTTATLSGGLTAPAWNGSTGGVLVIDVQQNLTLSGNVNLTGGGFRGGGGRQRGTTQPAPLVLEYVTTSATDRNASKGEGVAGTPRYTYSNISNTVTDNTAEGWTAGSSAAGAPGNAGGGATDWTVTNHNAGGGGGGNAGNGGRGGFSWNSAASNGDDIGGFGGVGIAPAADRVIMGGGGGAGSQNDVATPVSSGGAGGGIIMIRTGSVSGAGTLTVDGGAGQTPANEGGGGGGAAGSVVFVANTGSLAGLTIHARGGAGGNAWPTQVPLDGAHGPGGGGSGGSVLVNVGGASIDVAGGTNGTTLTSQLPYGAQSGANGTSATINPANIPGLEGGATAPVLSGSTKTVQDLNGGDAEPGDSLRYTITLTESAGNPAAGVVVTDDMPGNTVNFNVVSFPAGASNVSTGAGTGANGTGFLEITGVSVAANGSATIIYDVEVSGTAQAGDLIENSATITAPSGTVQLAADRVTVSASSLPSSGTKALYMDTAAGVTRELPAVNNPTTTFTQINSSTSSDPSSIWSLTPALATSFTIDAGNVSIPVYAIRTGNAGGGGNRSIRVELIRGAAEVLASQTLTQSLGTTAATPSLVTFTLNLPNAVTFAAGQNLSLRIVNTTNHSNRPIQVFPRSAALAAGATAGRTRLLLPTSTVINVDSVTTFDAAFPGGSPTTSFAPGATVWVRASVSDPFGAFDINSASINVVDPNAVLEVSAGGMTEVASDGAIKTYQFSYTLPFIGPEGVWTLSVTGIEGFEQEITHSRNGGFTVAVPEPADVGPVAEWRMDEFGWNGTAAEVIDSSDNGNSGVARGQDTVPTTVPAQVCFGGEFRGQGFSLPEAPFYVDAQHYVQVSDSASLSPLLAADRAMTLGGWFQAADTSGTRTLLHKGEGGASQEYRVIIVDGQLRLEIWNQFGGSQTAVISNQSLATGTWYFFSVSVQRDSASDLVRVRGYLYDENGQIGSRLQTFVTLPYAGKDTSGDLFLGATSFGSNPTQFFDGVLDEIRIYPSERSQAQIASHWQDDRPCSDPSGGLLVEYLFEDVPFTGTVTDTGGNNYDASVENGVITRLFEPAFIDGAGGLTCRYGRFGGNPDGVSAGNVDIGLGGKPTMTVMAWVRWGIPPGDGDGWATVVTSNDAADTGQFWLQHNSGNTAFEFALQTGAGRTFVQSSVAPVQNQWQHVAGVYDGSELRIYVDGTLAGSTTHSGVIRAFNANTELNLGRWKPAGRFFNGDIDEVRIYDTALTQGDIMSLMQTTRPCPDYAPEMMIAKFSVVLSDPVNGSSNPKRIPGAIIQYEILVTNQGPRPPDPASIVIRDALPPQTSFAFPGAGDPVTFVDGSTSSGLSLDFASDVAFSTQPGGGAPFDHAATDDGNGVDPAVTGLRITPSGQMNGAADEGPNSSFNIRFRVRLN